MIAFLAMAVLVGMLGLVMDGGYAYCVSQRGQATADAAALVAAADIPYGLSRMTAEATALSSLNPEGGSAVTTTLNYPYQGNSTMVQVINTTYYQPIFLGIIGVRQLKISSQAVAENYTPASNGTANPWSCQGSSCYGGRSVVIGQNCQGVDSFCGSNGPYGKGNRGSKGNIGTGGTCTINGNSGN